MALVSLAFRAAAMSTPVEAGCARRRLCLIDCTKASAWSLGDSFNDRNVAERSCAAATGEGQARYADPTM